METSDGTLPATFPKRACAACARGKASCVFLDGGDRKCQRCTRLQKTCEPAPTKVRKPPRKRAALSTAAGIPNDQVQKLEQKLDGLVTLLTSTQRQQAVEQNSNASDCTSTSIAQTEAVAEYVGSHSQSCHLSGPPVLQSLFAQTTPDVSLPSVAASSDFSSNSQAESIVDFSPTSQDANIVLQRFRNGNSSYFPFIAIPHTVSGDQLREERPFLYRCIYAIARLDPSQQNPREQSNEGKAIIKEIAERMYVNGERSLELLLGILVYAAGTHYHFMNMPQMTGLLTSALALACDLNLTKPIPTSPPHLTVFESQVREHATARYLAMVNTKRTQEERRAILGCYFLSSRVTTFFRKTPQIFGYSAYLEECLASILDTNEQANDRLAVALVRLQRISERIHQSPWHDKNRPPTISNETLFMFNTLRDDLKTFYDNLPDRLQNNATLRMNYHAAQIALYDIGLCSQQPQTTRVSGPEFRRVEMLYASLEANQRLLDTYFTFPVIQSLYFSLPIWSCVTQSLISLQALSTFNHHGWNLDYVRQTVDFDHVIERIVARFEKVSTEPGCEGIVMYSYFANKMSGIKKYVDCVTRGPDIVDDPRYGLEDSFFPEIPNTGDFMGFLDEAMLVDLGTWDQTTTNMV